MRTIALAAALSGFCAVPAAAEGRLVSATGALSAGERVFAPGDALPEAELRLSSGTALIEIQGGRLLLKGPASFTPGKSSVSLSLGGLLSALKSGRRFSVRTPAAVAAVRGTEFYVSAGPERSYVCLCRGALEVSGKGMKNRAMKSSGHSSLLFRRGPSGAVSTDGKSAGVVGHDDAELAALRASLEKEAP